MTIRISDSAYLKHFTPDDKDDLFSLVDSNRSHLNTFLAWPVFTKTPKDSLSFINDTLKDGIDKCRTWGIYHDEILCGVISLDPISMANKKGEIGYWIGSAHTGKGLVTKATHAVCGYAFNHLDFNRVTILCSTANSSSANIPKRLGFTLEGILRQNEVVGDNTYDHYVFSLLKSEYKS